VKNSLSEDDTKFINYLAFDDLQTEYITKKKELYHHLDQKYKQEEQSLRNKKLEGIELDKDHRMVLNACIFPFSQEGPLAKFGYYFIRASPLSELEISNLDFLLFHPDPDTYAIFGEAKGQVNDAQRVVDQTKKRMKLVYDKQYYIKQNYFKNLNSELEFVLGVWMSYQTEIVKTVQRKGGEIKVWGTGPQINTMKPELSFVRPWVQSEPIGKTMFHKDRSLNQELANIETSWDYKSIFPDSHIFAKLSLLAWIREKEDGSFELSDLLEIVKQELDYLEDERIQKETEHILTIGEETGFIEKVPNKSNNYKIISRAKKADSREEEIKKKWINFSIAKDNEAERKEELLKLQEKFKEKRSKRKTLSEYS